MPFNINFCMLLVAFALALFGYRNSPLLEIIPGRRWALAGMLVVAGTAIIRRFCFKASNMEAIETFGCAFVVLFFLLGLMTFIHIGPNP